MGESETTYRQHYQQVEAQGGHEPKLHVSLPKGLQHIWHWFADLSTTCGEGGIGYSEIQAWARLTGRSPAIYEVKLLKKLDKLYLKEFRS